MSATTMLVLGRRRRLPIILQTEAAECGLACLAMISQHHGNREDLAEMRRRFGTSLRGATLKDLTRISDTMGFAARPLRLEIGELPELRLPCILHWDMNHFVVLESVTRRRVRIHDPAEGERLMTHEEVGRHFTGIALELVPTSRFESRPPAPRLKLSQLLGNVHGLRRVLGHLLGLAGAIEVFAMAAPFFMGWVIDHAIVGSDRDLLVTLAAGFALLLVLRVGVEALRSWMLMGMNASLRVQSRANLFTHLQNLPSSYFDTRHLADVMSRFESQDQILNAVTSELVEAVLDGLMAVITLAIMFLMAPALTWLVIAGAALYASLRWATYAPLRHASAEAIVWGARRDSHFLETLRGIRTIKLHNAQDERRSRWLNLLVETVNRELTTDKLQILFRSANSLLLGILAIVVIGLGAASVMDGTFTVGLLIAFIAYKDQFLSRVSELVNRTVDLTMLRMHADRLADIALSKPEERSPPSPRQTHRLTVRLELRNIRFRYSETEPWLLDGVNLVVKPGQSVSVIGPSGGGKTTLLKILAGLLQPTEGEILIDGEPMSRIGVDNYRTMIGVVMQDDQLFAGSIADNISFFSENPDPDVVRDCAILASVHDDVMAMPMRYDTLVGDMGTMLSGGQKQRILIARAIYRLPAILLLDEATSHLDIRREAAVNLTFKQMKSTRIVIAHRPETIRSSDRVVELRQGRLVEVAPLLLG